MKSSRARAAVLAVFTIAILVLPGCAGFSVMKGGERTSVGSGLTVVPPSDWNRFTGPQVEFWTLDGPALQQVRFVKGVADGEAIYFIPDSDSAGIDDKGIPVYRKGMNAIEISELVQATLARQEAQQLEISELRPDEFAGRAGFSFQYEFLTKEGLAMKGMAMGAVVQDRLYMAIYLAAKVHYFDRGFEDFRKMLQTARIESSSS